jgi:hypothetical protein
MDCAEWTCSKASRLNRTPASNAMTRHRRFAMATPPFIPADICYHVKRGAGNQEQARVHDTYHLTNAPSLTQIVFASTTHIRRGVIAPTRNVFVRDWVGEPDSSFSRSVAGAFMLPPSDRCREQGRNALAYLEPHLRIAVGRPPQTPRAIYRREHKPRS